MSDLTHAAGSLPSGGVSRTACYHLPGLFEFHELYSVFLPLWKEHRDWFYSWCAIGSIYGAPADALWGGGRVGFGEKGIERQVLELCREYGISARLTFSNSQLKEEHLSDPLCNRLCALLAEYGEIDGNAKGHADARNGVIVHSDLLAEYIRQQWPSLYLVSSTTKVLTDFNSFTAELQRPDFAFVVPDFRLNTAVSELSSLPQRLKDKVEFLCNECCSYTCGARKQCYEHVSRSVLGETTEDWICHASESEKGYVFSKAMKNPGFIGIDAIQTLWLPVGFSNFKIEGRSLGSALILEFLLYYLTKPEHQLEVREAIYLDNSLDLF